MRVRRKTLPALLLLLTPLCALGWFGQKEFGRLESRAQRSLEIRAGRVLEDSIERFEERLKSELQAQRQLLVGPDGASSPAELSVERSLRAFQSSPWIQSIAGFDDEGRLVFPSPTPRWTDALLFADSAPTPGLRRAEHAEWTGDLERARELSDAELTRLESRARTRPAALLRARFQSAGLARRDGDENVAIALYRRILEDLARYDGDRSSTFGAIRLYARLGLAELEAENGQPRAAEVLLHALAHEVRPAIPEVLARVARRRLLSALELEFSPHEEVEAQRDRLLSFVDRFADPCEANLQQQLADGGASWPLVITPVESESSTRVLIEPIAPDSALGFFAYELDWNALAPSALEAEQDFAIEVGPRGRGSPDALAARFDRLGLEWTVTLEEGGEALNDSRRGERNRVLALLGLIGTAALGAFLLMRTTAREAEFADAKLALLSRVSHDLRTPLSLIRLYAETLGMGRAKTPEQAREFADVIVRETDALNRQFDRMIDSAERRRPDFEYQPASTDVSAALSEWSEKFAPRAQDEGFRFEVEIAEGLRATLDRQALESAVQNLCENALKYGRPAHASPGAPTSSPLLRLRLSSTSDRLLIEVVDHGPGVPRSDRERIFGNFERGSNAGEARGSGLGLWLVRDFADSHQGQVNVTDSLDRECDPGATFRIDLPLDR